MLQSNVKFYRGLQDN